MENKQIEAWIVEFWLRHKFSTESPTGEVYIPTS